MKRCTRVQGDELLNELFIPDTHEDDHLELRLGTCDRVPGAKVNLLSTVLHSDVETAEIFSLCLPAGKEGSTSYCLVALAFEVGLEGVQDGVDGKGGVRSDAKSMFHNPLNIEGD